MRITSSPAGVRGTRVEIAGLFEATQELARWWASVYLDVRVVEPGGPHGLRQVVNLYTKWWLPYTLRWQFTVVEQRYPYGSVLEARGNFVGRGEWIARSSPLIIAGRWHGASAVWSSSCAAFERAASRLSTLAS